MTGRGKEGQDMLADFAKRNFLVRPDETFQPDLDRIEWILTDHDVKVEKELKIVNACVWRAGEGRVRAR